MKNVRKILVFKLCCFGDIVFITPSVKSLRENFPDAEIVLISSSWIKPLFPFIEDADRLIIYDPPSEDESLFKKTIKAFALIKLLRSERFDLAFLGHRNNIFGTILFLSGIRRRMGFSETRFTNITADFESGIHESERYLKIFTKNEMKTAEPSARLRRNSGKTELRKKIGLAEFAKTAGLFPFGGVNPGTKMPIKRWGIENYVTLAAKLASDKDTAVILFEGKERDETINKELKLPENVFVRKIDFSEIPACDVFVSADTGPLHIAAALGVPTVGLFGPSDPRLVAPQESEGHVHLKKDIPCSPCYTPSTAIDRKNKQYWKGDNFVCRIGTNECMKIIGVEEVFSAIMKLLIK